MQPGSLMSMFTRLLRFLLPETDSVHGRDEAYLANAVDLSDLERRMQDIESGRHLSGIDCGLHAR
jgi:hypothetical protein